MNGNGRDYDNEYHGRLTPGRIIDRLIAEQADQRRARRPLLQAWAWFALLIFSSFTLAFGLSSQCARHPIGGDATLEVTSNEAMPWETTVDGPRLTSDFVFTDYLGRTFACQEVSDAAQEGNQR